VGNHRFRKVHPKHRLRIECRRRARLTTQHVDVQFTRDLRATRSSCENSIPRCTVTTFGPQDYEGFAAACRDPGDPGVHANQINTKQAIQITSFVDPAERRLDDLHDHPRSCCEEISL